MSERHMTVNLGIDPTATPALVRHRANELEEYLGPLAARPDAQSLIQACAKHMRDLADYVESGPKKPECPPDIWAQILAALGDGDRITQAHAHASGPRQTFGAHHFLLTRPTEPRFTLIVFENREWRYGGDFTTGDLAELVPLLGEHLPPLVAPIPPPKHVDPSQTWAELWRQGFSDGVRAAGRRA